MSQIAFVAQLYWVDIVIDISKMFSFGSGYTKKKAYCIDSCDTFYWLYFRTTKFTFLEVDMFNRFTFIVYFSEMKNKDFS